jgi:DNA-nicking Smr family endonuclease
VRGELDELLDLGSVQGRTLRQRLNLLHEQVWVAADRAADEIFRQTNSTSSMATETQGQRVQLDLHGLYVAEALQKVEEMVLPVLPVVGFMLITGRGLHSSRSSRAEGDEVHSVLKQAVVEYLQERGLGVEPVPGNDGAIYVLCTTSNADAHA